MTKSRESREYKKHFHECPTYDALIAVQLYKCITFILLDHECIIHGLTLHEYLHTHCITKHTRHIIGYLNLVDPSNWSLNSFCKTNSTFGGPIYFGFQHQHFIHRSWLHPLYTVLQAVSKQPVAIKYYINHKGRVNTNHCFGFMPSLFRTEPEGQQAYCALSNELSDIEVQPDGYTYQCQWHRSSGCWLAQLDLNLVESSKMDIPKH